MAPPDEGDRPTLTCPACGATTAHPEDVAEGYCVECHDWTSPPAAMRHFAEHPDGARVDAATVSRALRDLREDR